MTDAAMQLASTVGVGRSLTPKATATRNRILETATDLFASEGYAAVSVREVAAKCGLSSGAIYATFRGKADLLIEALRVSIATDLAEVPAELLARPLPEMDAYQFTAGDTPRRQRLRALMLEAAVAARSDEQVRVQLEEMLRSRLDEWGANHELWQQAVGADPLVDMRALTALLMCIELGAGVLAVVGIDEPSADQTAVLVEHLLRSLVARPMIPGGSDERV